jgi:hypothetical protein
MRAPLLIGIAATLTLVASASIAQAALPPRPAPTPDPSLTAATEPSADPGVSVTIVNWGKPVSIVNSKHKAWAHLSASSTPVEVTVRVDPGDQPFQGYLVTLGTPDAFEGPPVQYCADEFTRFAADSTVQCTFQVPISPGPNRIDVDFHSGSVPTHLYAHGVVYGGDLKVSARIQVLESSGEWQDLSEREVYTSPGSQSSSIRYLVFNSGEIPFMAERACTHQLVLPGSFFTCVLRGPRPMYALAGAYKVPIELVDPAGGDAVFGLHGVLAVPGFLHGPNG